MDIRFFPSEGLLIYNIDQLVNESFIHKLSEVQSEIAHDKEIKILAIVSTFRGYTSLKAAKSALVFDLKILKNLSHYALVSDIKSLKILIKLIGLFFPKTNFKTFYIRERKQAMEWLDKKNMV